MNLLFIFIHSGETQGRYIGHYVVGADFYNTLISRNKDLLRVPFGFGGVAYRPNVPLEFQQA